MMIVRLIIVSLVVLLTACQSTGVTVDDQLELEGTWHIEKINGQAVVNYSPAQLSFGTNGVLSGNNSCNTFTGNYTFVGSSLGLAPEAGTMKACVDALEAQEEQVMVLMLNVSQARLTKSKLLLKDENNKTLFVLKKMESENIGETPVSSHD
ncbi:META domain-containing protein [Shewanella surugensis]|uniref:META domain-containing protein n=1 Tax=Shewanella surugensis TaxID=212020 RepID=A0ABT0L6C1_9GAMM|nr:META domain-containing protein [Shewanella surugensis]MCL1122922.1 META domain-containing protein [Shewanella surugensis]